MVYHLSKSNTECKGGFASESFICTCRYFSVGLCKRETKSVRCLQHQHQLLQRGRGDAESGPDLCLQRGRKHLLCSAAATTSPHGGNVKTVALYKQPLRVCRCVHQGDLCTHQSESHKHLFMWSCVPSTHTHTYIHVQLYAGCRSVSDALFCSHALSVNSPEWLFSGAPHQVTMSRPSTLWCAALSSAVCAAASILRDALANAFTSNGERQHHLDTIDRGPIWGQTNRACLG